MKALQWVFWNGFIRVLWTGRWVAAQFSGNRPSVGDLIKWLRDPPPLA